MLFGYSVVELVKAVAEQLLVGIRRDLVLAFVLPSEMLTHPNIRPALPAPGFGDAALETIPSAVRIGRGRLRLVQQFAEVEEMLLVGAAFRKFDGLPFVDKFERRHEGLSFSRVMSEELRRL